MYMSPVMYPTSKIPQKWMWLYSLNPMTGVIGGFRWALFGEQESNSLFWLSAAMVVVLFMSGLYYFRRMERVFADLV
jgi:lipopolysaccharide transport system permease protein